MLKEVAEVSSEYQVVLDRGADYKDFMLLRVECTPGIERNAVEKAVKKYFKSRIGIAIEVEALPLGALPRSEKKTARVIDKRYC